MAKLYSFCWIEKGEKMSDKAMEGVDKAKEGAEAAKDKA
jgi:hypothetical protein